MLSRRLKLRIGCTASIALAALSFGAVSANAGVLVSSAPSCDGQPLSTPFAPWPWLDPASYTPLPGGSFESSTAGWSLSGGATVGNGNESYYVAGAGTNSLTIPSGGSATSPVICVGIEHPTLRFFAKRNSGGLLGVVSTVRVDVLFESTLGLVSSLPIGVVLPSNSWQATLPMTVLANLLPLLPGNYTPVQFRFTPLLGGTWSIDDVYVDPYQRH